MVDVRAATPQYWLCRTVLGSVFAEARVFEVREAIVCG